MIKDFNFSWIIVGELAGCAGPQFDEELEFLYSQGIRALVRLEEVGYETQHIEAAGMEDLLDPIPDFHAPPQEQIDRIINFIKSNLAQHKPVAVSCGAGIGRTGTILTCFFVSNRYTAKQAIDVMASKGRKPYETEEQKRAIEEYARRLMEKP